MLLTVLMPIYNEEKTVQEIVKRILELDLDLELIIINNGSIDNTDQIIQRFSEHPKVTIIEKEINIGKGDAIRSGLESAHGKYTVIQDGDLEYEPGDIIRMVELAKKKNALAVFGSRILNPESGVSYQRYLWGGKLLTFLANLLYGAGITDESTCYKMVRTDILKGLNLRCRRFEFCPEVVAKLGRNGIEILELPISYAPRGFKEGKKIRWTDGVQAIWTLFKYRLKPFSKVSIEAQ